MNAAFIFSNGSQAIYFSSKINGNGKNGTLYLHNILKWNLKMHIFYAPFVIFACFVPKNFMIFFKFFSLPGNPKMFRISKKILWYFMNFIAEIVSCIFIFMSITNSRTYVAILTMFIVDTNLRVFIYISETFIYLSYRYTGYAVWVIWDGK